MIVGWNKIGADWKPEEYINVSDLNAIEKNIECLHETLNKLPYNIPQLIYKVWDNTGIPNTSDIKRICENIKIIADYYYEPPEYKYLADIPNKKSLNNVDLNDIEKCLLWLQAQIESGRDCNTHGTLQNKLFTQAGLSKFKHQELRREVL
ncbi:MAG: hypothetical protein DBX47_07365 [Clostridiales bacterium]|nr:MAG: hypothetical protein DBX47_07365 [Clostridiales bacterium]